MDIYIYASGPRGGRKHIHIHTLCYAVALPSRKAAFRAGFWPDCYRESTEIGPPPAEGRLPGSSPVRIRPGGSIYGPETLLHNYLRPGSTIARWNGSRGQVRPETGQKQNKHYNLYPLGGRRLLDRTTYSKLVLFRFHRSLKSRTGSRLPDPAVLCGSRPCRGSGTLVCGHKPPAFTVPLTFCMRAMRTTCHGEQHIHRHTGELPGLPEITQFILEGTRQNGWWG